MQNMTLKATNEQTRKISEQNFIDTDNSVAWWLPEGSGEGGVGEGKGVKHTATADWTSSGEHTMQYADEVSQNCILETCIM